MSDIIHTVHGAERLFRDVRFFKGLNAGRTTKSLAVENHVSEHTVRSGYNRIKLMEMKGELDEQLKTAQKVIGVYHEPKPRMPSKARTASGVRFTPL